MGNLGQRIKSWHLKWMHFFGADLIKFVLIMHTRSWRWPYSCSFFQNEMETTDSRGSGTAGGSGKLRSRTAHAADEPILDLSPACAKHHVQPRRHVLPARDVCSTCRGCAKAHAPAHVYPRFAATCQSSTPTTTLWQRAPDICSINTD